MKVRIVGLGVMSGDETCVLSGKEATGYVEDKYHDVAPVNLKLLGPGKLGQYVDLPDEYRGAAKDAGILPWQSPFSANGTKVIDREGDVYGDFESKEVAEKASKDLSSLLLW